MILLLPDNLHGVWVEHKETGRFGRIAYIEYGETNAVCLWNAGFGGIPKKFRFAGSSVRIDELTLEPFIPKPFFPVVEREGTLVYLSTGGVIKIHPKNNGTPRPILEITRDELSEIITQGLEIYLGSSSNWRVYET